MPATEAERILDRAVYMIEKFGTQYGPPLQRGDKTTCIASLQPEIDRFLLFGFYNPRTGQCFPSHQTVATKARCGVRTVQRALKSAREDGLIQWAHGLARDGWRVLRTSNRYAFAAFLTIRRIVFSLLCLNSEAVGK